jgi:hypothetical protein
MGKAPIEGKKAGFTHKVSGDSSQGLEQGWGTKYED